MDAPLGTVVSLDDRAGVVRATVDVEIAGYCPRCAAGTGCGAGLLTAAGQARRIEMDVDRDARPAVGDSVRLSLPPSMLLRAAAIAYGWPLAGALLGAATATVLGTGDALAAALTLVAMALGAGIGRWRLLANGRCIRRFVPDLERQA